MFFNIKYEYNITLMKAYTCVKLRPSRKWRIAISLYVKYS